VLDCSDQKVANQKEHHRQRKWYMPLFYQMIEWTVVNTGVFLRERKGGKKDWSARKLKVHLAEEMARKGGVEPHPLTVAPLPHAPVPPAGARALVKIRLDRNLDHFPVTDCNRARCVAHVQRAPTYLRCSTCAVPLCADECWRKFHTEVDYLFDDPKRADGPVHRTVCRY